MCNRLKNFTIAITIIELILGNPNPLQFFLSFADWIDCISITSLLYMHVFSIKQRRIDYQTFSDLVSLKLNEDLLITILFDYLTN